MQGSHIQRLIRLAFLAPDLKAAILTGHMPPAMTLQRLMQFGVADLWSQQRRDMAGRSNHAGSADKDTAAGRPSEANQSRRIRL